MLVDSLWLLAHLALEYQRSYQLRVEENTAFRNGWQFRAPAVVADWIPDIIIIIPQASLESDPQVPWIEYHQYLQVYPQKNIIKRIHDIYSSIYPDPLH